MTARMRPVLFTWNDDVMVPVARLLPLCRKQFVVGQEYPMGVVQPRSIASHRQYFAALHDAWNNLSEADAERFKTDEHLRAWALVQTGFCKETDYPFESPEQAQMVAKIIRSRSAYAVIKISGDVVKVFDPESQAMYGPGAMSPERFKASKIAVLDLVSGMAGITRGTLTKEAGKSA